LPEKELGIVMKEKEIPTEHGKWIYPCGLIMLWMVVYLAITLKL